MKKLLIVVTIACGLMLPFGSIASAKPIEKHPQIHAAIHALENAKKHLMEANHDFGGHREAALHACEEAIGQLRLALQADTR